jgi:CRISPR-associated protein Cmr2
MAEIGKGSASPVKGYVGYVYADGNRMGEHLKTLLKDAESDSQAIGRLIEFSGAFDAAVSDALVESADELIIEQKRKRKDGTEKPYYPIEFTVTGGDDLITILPADVALEFACRLCKKFQERFESSTFYNSLSREKQAEHRLSLSAGVVLAHDTFPINNLLDLATELQKSAKRLSRALSEEKRKTVNTIDFMLVTGSGSQSMRYVRSTEMVIGNDSNHTHLLTGRPYTDTELLKLLDDIRNLKDAQFPKTKLNAIYEALFTNSTQATLDILYLSTRLNKNQRKIFRDCMSRQYDETPGNKLMPWLEIRYRREVYPHLSDITHCTRLLDIVEAYSFVKPS